MGHRFYSTFGHEGRRFCHHRRLLVRTHIHIMCVLFLLPLCRTAPRIRASCTCINIVEFLFCIILKPQPSSTWDSKLFTPTAQRERGKRRKITASIYSLYYSYRTDGKGVTIPSISPAQPTGSSSTDNPEKKNTGRKTQRPADGCSSLLERVSAFFKLATSSDPSPKTDRIPLPPSRDETMDL